MRFLLSCLVSGLLTLVCVAQRPSILLIMADDLGYSDLGCYGSTIDTPALDRLAAQGTRLSNFRVNPMCVVTRTSLMTGHTHTFRLYRVQDPITPVWTADPEPSHPAQAKTTISFTNLPTLQPGTTYFLLADPAWARSNKKPLPPLNDGAYWFRFRTRP